MVKHSVIFSFKKGVDQNARESFLDASAKLSNIPGVKNLEVLKQVSSKNNFEYGIVMEFDNNDLYHAYNNHPEHQQFIEQYWLKNVDTFLEIDFQAI